MYERIAIGSLALVGGLAIFKLRRDIKNLIIVIDDMSATLNSVVKEVDTIQMNIDGLYGLGEQNKSEEPKTGRKLFRK